MGSSRIYNDKDPDKLPDLQPLEENGTPLEDSEGVGETSVFYARPMEDADESDTMEDYPTTALLYDHDLELDPALFNTHELYGTSEIPLENFEIDSDRINYPERYKGPPPSENHADKVTLIFDDEELQLPDDTHWPCPELFTSIPWAEGPEEQDPEELARELEYLLNQFEEDEAPPPPQSFEAPNDREQTDTDELKAFLKSEFLSDPGEWPLHEPMDYIRHDAPGEENPEADSGARALRNRSHLKQKPNRPNESERGRAGKKKKRQRPETEITEFPAERPEPDYYSQPDAGSASGRNERSSSSALRVSLILAALMGAILWLASQDNYAVRSDLLLVPEKLAQSPVDNWSLEKEALSLESPGLLYAFSEQVFQGDTHESSLPLITARFKSEGKLMKWLSQSLSVYADQDRGFVSLSLEGENPDLLKDALNRYVAFYANYRPGIIAKDRERAVAAAAPKIKVRNMGPEIERIDQRLADLNSRIREAELALNIMKSGKGPFRGFLASDNAADIPSISSFQSRIVELELKKKELEVRYKKGSRELEEIDAQIDGVRRAMMECIDERVLFLKAKAGRLASERDRIMAKTTSTERAAPEDIPIKPKTTASDFKLPPSKARAPKLGEGLYLVEPAHVVKTPIKERLKALFDRLSGNAAQWPEKLSGNLRKTMKTYPFSCEIPGYDKTWDTVATANQDHSEHEPQTAHNPTSHARKQDRDDR